MNSIIEKHRLIQDGTIVEEQKIINQGFCCLSLARLAF